MRVTRVLNAALRFGLEGPTRPWWLAVLAWPVAWGAAIVLLANGAPWWCTVGAVVVGLLLTWWLQARRLRLAYYRSVAEKTGSRCPRCDYDLTGLDRPVCPECGTDAARFIQEARKIVD